MSRPRASRARGVALRCLRRIDIDGGYAHLVLAGELDRAKLPARDRAFVTELVLGTTRMRRGCDALVDRFINREPAPDVRCALRLGAYQLHYAGVPAHAAVAETVAVVDAPARGFVNAVLRRVASTPMRWPSAAVEASYPDWIVDRFVAELGDDAWPTLQAMNIGAETPQRDDGYRQDLSSQWVAAAVGAGPGDLVLDVCAAPGGKATAMAATGASVLAADIHPARARQVADSAASTGHPVAVVVADGTRPPWRTGSFDRVLLDAPCTGFGALRRRADARWRIRPDDVTDLAELQRELLDATAPLVRPGGWLVYSVCTLTAAESIDHPTPAGFEVVTESPGAEWRPYGQGFRILPHDHDSDGMTLIRYRRRP